MFFEKPFSLPLPNKALFDPLPMSVMFFFSLAGI